MGDREIFHHLKHTFCHREEKQVEAVVRGNCMIPIRDYVDPPLSIPVLPPCHIFLLFPGEEMGACKKGEERKGERGGGRGVGSEGETGGGGERTKGRLAGEGCKKDKARLCGRKRGIALVRLLSSTDDGKRGSSPKEQLSESGFTTSGSIRTPGAETRSTLKNPGSARADRRRGTL